MRELTLDEIQEVSGGAVAPFRDVAGGIFAGALSGALAGSRLGIYGAIGGAVFYGAMGGTTVMIKYSLH